MRNRNFLITSLMLIILLLLPVILLWIIFRKVEVVVPPETPVHVEAEERPIYALPSNAITTTQDIEENIKKEAARKSVAAMKAPVRKEAPEKKAQAELPPAAVERAKKIPGALPVKKEVKFPTYEERKSAQSQSSIITY